MCEEKITDRHARLLPCPFCGNDNIRITKKPLWREVDGSYHGYKDRYAFEVVCDRCGAHPIYSKNDTIYRSEEEAISHVVDKWNERVQDLFLESMLSNAEEAKDKSPFDWASVYEYARSMENCLDDNDEEDLKACIECVKEIAVKNGGDRYECIMHDEEGHKAIESCVKVIDDANWLLERTADVEKREKLYSILLEATKALRSLGSTISMKEKEVES